MAAYGMYIRRNAPGFHQGRTKLIVYYADRFGLSDFANILCSREPNKYH